MTVQGLKDRSPCYAKVSTAGVVVLHKYSSMQIRSDKWELVIEYPNLY